MSMVVLSRVHDTAIAAPPTILICALAPISTSSSTSSLRAPTIASRSKLITIRCFQVHVPQAGHRGAEMRLAPHGRCSSLHRDQGSKALPAPVQHRAPNRAQPRCLPENAPRRRQSRRRCGYHRSAVEARNRGQLGLLDRRQPSRQRAKEVPETPSRSHSPLLPPPRSLGLPAPPTQQSGDDLEQQSTANRANPGNSRACSRPDRAPPVRSRRSGRALSSLDERARGTSSPAQFGQRSPRSPSRVRALRARGPGSRCPLGRQTLRHPA